ncbi:MAG: YhfC family intramembrane metalloprotease [Candidatus Hydrogenedentes bacterium]|nr:YhfC family intramembrane metalloprotease [Candidatus Hydrogenedentota bacterium]
MELSNTEVLTISGIGMVLVALLSVVICRRRAGSRLRWMWLGAGLWFVAVLMKGVTAALTNPAIFSALERSLPHSLYVAVGSLFVGISSAFFEIGLTWLTVMIWRELGRTPDKAIGIGVGAGAIEAALLGLSSLSAAVVLYLGLPGSEDVTRSIRESGVHASILFLVPIVERVLAILCHTSSRALVFLGTTHRNWVMVLAGAALFAYIDSVAGFAHLSGMLKTYSVWWVELAIAPAALVSIPIIRWCARRFHEPTPDNPPAEPIA